MINRFNDLQPLQLLSILFIVCCICLITCAKWGIDKEIVVLFGSLASGLIGAITMLIRAPHTEQSKFETNTMTTLHEPQVELEILKDDRK